MITSHKMKTSINFKAAKSDSEAHNFRKKTFDYIRRDLTAKNEYWSEEKLSDRLHKIESYCKEKSGRKLQKNAMPVREAVVVIKEDTTMQDLHNLSKRLEEELRIRIFQIAIHKDEGHFDKEAKEWKPNYHAHLIADWQDLQTGKTLKHQSFHYSKMQDITAECLGMERGVEGSKVRLEAIEFKIQKKEQELLALDEKINNVKSELSSKKFEDLIVKESDFLGFKKIRTDQTLDNYEKAFKTYNIQLSKNKQELEFKNKLIKELQSKNFDLKKEISILKNKLSTVLSSGDIYSSEKIKYVGSVKDTLIKTLQFEKTKLPQLFTGSKEKLIAEINDVCKKVSQENNIAFSAFEEVFKDSESVSQIISLLNFDSSEINYNLEQIPLQQKKKKQRRL
jgi:AraC-like DNA-binding protein